MLTKALLGIAAAMMCFTAFSGTVLILDGGQSGPVQVA